MVLSSTLSFQALLTFPYPTLSSLITLSSLALTHVHDILLIVVCLTSPEYKLHKSRVLPVFVHYSITQLVGLVHCRHTYLLHLGEKRPSHIINYQLVLSVWIQVFYYLNSVSLITCRHAGKASFWAHEIEH